MNVVSIRRGESNLDGPPEAPEEEQGAQLKHVYGVVLRRWRIMAPVALIVFALIAAYGLLAPKVYTANALVMVNPGRQQVLAQGQSIDDATPSSAAVDSEIEVLRSDILAVRLVNALHLDQDPEWNHNLEAPGPLAAILAPLRALGGGAQRPSDPQSVRNAIARDVERAIAVRRRGLSYGIDVSMDAHDPARAAVMTNKLVELYLLSQTEARFDAAQRANGWLSQRLDELRQEVERKERAADAFRVQHNLSVGVGGDPSQQPQNAEVQTMLVQASADLAEKEARLSQVQQLIRAGGSAESIATALNSPVVSELRAREATLAQSLAELRQRYSPEHPRVTSAQSELDNVHQRIQDEIRRITASLQNDVQVARARLGTLQGSFGTAAGSSNQNNDAVIQYRELVREAAAARAVHESFLQRFHEVADQGDLPIATSRLVSPATPPEAPSKPNLSSVMLLAVLLGALSGAGLGFLIETLDASISSPEDAERKLGALAIASVPVLTPHDLRGLPAHRRGPGDYLVEKPMSGFAEALRVLRTSLQHARLDRKLRVVAVTSALPNEGKTTMSLCLARISAMSGQKVILVDCDLRRRSLSDVAGVSPSAGLLEVLLGAADWRRAVVQDSDSSAEILGTLSSRFTPQDVFSSQAMERLIEDLRGAYDLVILDCAPVLAIAETRTVATHADLTLFVVRSEKTPAAAVRTAMREIQHGGAEVAGIALNCVDPRRPGRGSYGDTLYYRHARNYYHT